MKKAIISLIILIALSAMVSAIDTNRTIYHNYSQLPVLGTIDFNFTLVPNSTIYFNLTKNDTRAILNFPKNITLNETQTEVRFVIAYTIPFFLEYDPGNTTKISTRINVTNSVSPTEVALDLDFLIKNPPPITNGTQNDTTQYLTLFQDGTIIEINTFTVSEFRRTHYINIIANTNQNLLFECGPFLTCPNLTMNVTNATNASANFTLPIQVYVPKGYPPGNYTSIFKVSQGNKSGTVTFKVFVNGDSIYNIIVYDIWNQSCYDSAETLARCYKEQARYNAEVANRLLYQLQSGNLSAICTNQTITKELVKYVEVGNIDPELYKAYQNTVGKYNQLVNSYSEMSRENEKCVQERATLTVKTDLEKVKLETDYNQKTQELMLQTEQQKTIEKENIKKLFSKIMGGVVALFVVFLLFGLYLQSNWVIENFPTKIVVALIIFLVMLWIIMAVYL